MGRLNVQHFQLKKKLVNPRLHFFPVDGKDLQFLPQPIVPLPFQAERPGQFLVLLQNLVVTNQKMSYGFLKTTEGPTFFFRDPLTHAIY